MRRVICDIFMIITTITSPTSAKAETGDSRPIDLAMGGQAAAPAADPPQVVQDARRQWIIYQELIVVHCQRDTATTHTVIACNRDPFAPKFSDDSSQEA